MTTVNDQFILAVNCGSSSLKFSLFGKEDLQLAMSGSVKANALGETHFIVQEAGGGFSANHPLAHAGVPAGIRELIAWLHDHHSRYPIMAIAHRLVQGGPGHRAPEVINAGLLKELHHYTYLAPNHIPAELQAITAFREAFPEAVAVACFDTFFHRDMPAEATYFPLPASYRKKGLIRYGFHGLSYEFILEKLAGKSPRILKRKLIIAHLGHGASMVAVRDGKSVDTTMGLSPLGGLIMGTRCGDLDPGVVLYLLRKEKMSAQQIDELLSKHSGLQAIAGCSDMESLVKSSSDDIKAREAITAFCYAIKKSIGALTAAMGGLDMLVFTGGIGENSAVIREYCCEGLKFLGIAISHRRNSKGRRVISKTGSKVKVKVLATDEAAIMAKHTKALISK